MQTDLTQLRQEIHWLVDVLSEEKLKAIRVLVEPPTLAESLASAPYDDEELLPEFAASLREAYASADKDNLTSHEEMLREFGL